nr:MAG TPA: hypothetical protein [Caudoviricetes sp.]
MNWLQDILFRFLCDIPTTKKWSESKPSKPQLSGARKRKTETT